MRLNKLKLIPLLFLLISLQALALDVTTTGTVTWVADGDTFRFSADDRSVWQALRDEAAKKQGATGRDMRVGSRFLSADASFLVRLANVDTAESRHPDATRNTRAGAMAAQHVKSLITGVRATVRCWEIGYYGRPICSLWMGDLELGSHLIRAGYSDYEFEYGRHPTLDREYREAQQAQGK